MERFFATPGKLSLCSSLLVPLLICAEISQPRLVVLVGTLGLASNIVGLILFHGTSNLTFEFQPCFLLFSQNIVTVTTILLPRAVFPHPKHIASEASPTAMRSSRHAPLRPSAGLRVVVQSLILRSRDTPLSPGNRWCKRPKKWLNLVLPSRTTGNYRIPGVHTPDLSGTNALLTTKMPRLYPLPLNRSLRRPTTRKERH